MSANSLGTTQEQIQWLVRKNARLAPLRPGEVRGPSQVRVLGPFGREQIRLMIENGSLDADDEVCPENSFWFALHESAEVKRFLGIEKISFASNSRADEATQPDLEATNPDLAPLDLEECTPTGDRQVTRKSGEKLSSPSKLALTNPATLREAEKSQTIFGIEKGRLLGILIVVGVVIAISGVLWVIQSLRA